MKITVKQLKQLIREALEETVVGAEALKGQHPEGQSVVFDPSRDPEFHEKLKAAAGDLPKPSKAEHLAGLSTEELVAKFAGMTPAQKIAASPEERLLFIDALRKAADELKAKGIQAESALLKNIVRRAVRSELKK